MLKIVDCIYVILFVDLLSDMVAFVGVPRWQPHRHSGLANLSSVGAVP